MFRYRKAILFFFFSVYFSALAQKHNEAFRLHIKRASSPLIVDGRIDEQAWNDAQIAGDFFMVLPMDTSLARVRTDVRMTYDDHNLYIVAECFHFLPGSYLVESLRRDFNFTKNDNFIFFIDPFDDQTNGFSFGANAAGAQWDGTMYEGGKVDLSWDNKWTSVVESYPDRYVFEASIPFKSIRFKKGIKEWGINFSRNDLKTSEKSSWAPVHRQFPTASLAYSGILVWDNPPPAPALNISIIPFALASLAKDKLANTPTVFNKEIGGDLKIGITSSLNFDLTFNPDFSQVEVDRQITNLDRFELFFPERRQFFLENGDLFSNLGYANLRPFFSRRIGLGIPIQYGARLSGKLNKNWRIGLMNIQTGKDDSRYLPVQNYTVASVQRKLFARSNLGLFMINKQSLNYSRPADSLKPAYSVYNRNAGIEYNLASSNNLWTGKAIAAKSFSSGKEGNDLMFAANLQYSSRKWTVGMQYESVGENYSAEVGYVPRRGYDKISPSVSRNFFPSGGAILSHGPKLVSYYYFDPLRRITDYENIFLYSATFRNQAVLAGWIANNYVQLLQSFDPTNMGKDTLARSTEHYWNAIGADLISKPQSLLTYTISTRWGGYYANGTRFNLSSEIGYRFQPYVSLALSTSYNRINLPQPWNRVSFLLIGPRIDLTLTNKFFFTAFVQYNGQTENVNVNTRIQWRYKPASDLYLVFTDNYYPENLLVKNRALVLKFNYWWNP